MYVTIISPPPQPGPSLQNSLPQQNSSKNWVEHVILPYRLHSTQYPWEWQPKGGTSEAVKESGDGGNHEQLAERKKSKTKRKRRGKQKGGEVKECNMDKGKLVVSSSNPSQVPQGPNKLLQNWRSIELISPKWRQK